MALTKGTNSYVTLDEAETYFEDRIDNTLWDAAASTDEVKERALVTAWEVLDALPWAGYTHTQDQNMAWPRVIPSFYDARQGREYRIAQNAGDDALVPVKKAQYELAYHYMSNPTVISQGAEVTNLTLGTLALDHIQNPSILPAFVRRIIRPYLIDGNGSNWFMAN